MHKFKSVGVVVCPANVAHPVSTPDPPERFKSEHKRIDEIQIAYSEARAKKTHTNRREQKLDVVNQFWKLSKAQKNQVVQRAAHLAESINPPESDPDQYDVPNLKDSRLIGTRGIVIRTHFDPNDEPAWVAFLAALEKLERESISESPDIQIEPDSDSDSEEEEAKGQGDEAAPLDGNDDTEMGDASPAPTSQPLTYESDSIFVVIDPTRQRPYHTLKERLSGASNITLLRLFNDACIAPSPELPANVFERIKPAHRLIDEHGYQEVYTGARLWVWDQQSTKDQALRLISQQAFVYGDATGDSFRVKTTHIWGLQLNLDDGMRISFSGGFGWDMNARERNLKESTTSCNLNTIVSTPSQIIPLTVKRWSNAPTTTAVEPVVLAPSDTSKPPYHSDIGEYLYLHPDVVTVATAGGNAGIALAWVGKALSIRTLIFIPTNLTTVQPELEMAGAQVIVGGTDSADALGTAQKFCETTPHAILMSSYNSASPKPPPRKNEAVRKQLVSGPSGLQQPNAHRNTPSFLTINILQPSQSFKYRGISLFASRAIAEHGSNVRLVMASGGNAGLALAWAGKALGVHTTIYIPAAAYEVQSSLVAAGADVIVGGKDYAEALSRAELFCSQHEHVVLVPSFGGGHHPTLWKGHSTIVHEVNHQLPNGIKPDAILCSVGGGGLLGGVLCGVNEVGWDQTRVIALETFGANCYHLSILANSKDQTSQRLIPNDVAVSTNPSILSDVQAPKVALARLPAITSKAASLGAPSPAQAVVEMGLARRDRAVQNPMKFGGVTPVSIPDEAAMRATLGFLDEQKMLLELACAATLAPAYIPGLLQKLVPKIGKKNLVNMSRTQADNVMFAENNRRPVVIFIVCGGSKILLNDAEKYQAIVQQSGIEGLRTISQRVIIDGELGLNL
ncbi:hypothetical protein CTheo_1693 [Ceratobasidium theobromae]|uniref:L-serine ammonia-lyase n=1 Tax=Ceratobasidium theobromae TaxID=1582974 RepID=A0A5N5QT95_9AGAM|nr:hypothetical protein CTheo_1693 [Ceratobasidium theobromae]